MKGLGFKVYRTILRSIGVIGGVVLFGVAPGPLAYGL